MLTFHPLKVYEKALAVGAKAQEVSDSWGRRHPIVNPFRRAAESIVLNIAEGMRLRPGPDKTRFLDLAAAAAVKPAVSLDLDHYQHETLLVDWDVAEGRELLSRVVAMVRGFWRSEQPVCARQSFRQNFRQRQRTTIRLTTDDVQTPAGGCQSAATPLGAGSRHPSGLTRSQKRSRYGP